MTHFKYSIGLTCPPAAQAATRAYCPPSFFSLLAAVVTSLTPVAPKGCPIDTEPPHLLIFSAGGAPGWEGKISIYVATVINL